MVVGFYARFCVTVVRSQSLSFGIGFVNAQNSADMAIWIFSFGRYRLTRGAAGKSLGL